MAVSMEDVKPERHNLWRPRNVDIPQLLLHSCSCVLMRNQPPRLDFAATERFGPISSTAADRTQLQFCRRVIR